MQSAILFCHKNLTADPSRQSDHAFLRDRIADEWNCPSMNLHNKLQYPLLRVNRYKA